jgi:hypothetical protein
MKSIKRSIYFILLACFVFTIIQAQTTIEKPNGVVVTTYPDGVTVTSYPNGAVVTSSGSCDLWILDWKEDGLLRGRTMNEKEQSIFDDLVKRLPVDTHIKIALVYFSQIEQEMWVLYEATKKDGGISRYLQDVEFFSSTLQYP